jgi:hypothetical protein
MQDARIILTQGKYATVDKEDYEYFSKFKWYYSGNYAVRHPKVVNGIRKGKISMHRVVLGSKDGEITDHINRNKLDNRKKNLRIVNNSQNTLNSPIRKSNHSSVTGVIFHKRDKKWQARISVGGKRIQLGYFTNLQEAKLAYEKIYRSYCS